MDEDAAVRATQLAFFGVSTLLIHTDVTEHRLPNRIVWPLLAGTVACLVAIAVLTGNYAQIPRAAAGGTGLCCFYALLRAASRGDLGGGDVKLALPVGVLLAWEGWVPLLVGGALAFVLGGAASLTLIAAGRATRDTHIAFGPWIVIGACLGLGLT